MDMRIFEEEDLVNILVKKYVTNLDPIIETRARALTLGITLGLSSSVFTVTSASFADRDLGKCWSPQYNYYVSRIRLYIYIYILAVR